MQQRQNFLPFFLVFFSLCFLFIFIGKSGIISSLASYVGFSSAPIRSTLINFFTLSGLQNNQISDLISENRLLRRQIVDKQKLEVELESIKNQLAVSGSVPEALIPARVIGVPAFIPGESIPQIFIIDKGKNDGVEIGNIVVLENNVVGHISEVRQDSSRVMLVINESLSISAKSQGGVNGIIKGTGGSLILDNVLLSQTLKKDELILTKGDVNEEGLGYPPDLIIGKISSVEKESQELFQKARVQSFLDFSNLTHVFILK